MLYFDLLYLYFPFPLIVCSVVGVGINRIPINGIIPEIAAIGVIATVVLSGIAGTIVGGVAGYLINVAINQCCGACSSVVQE